MIENKWWSRGGSNPRPPHCEGGVRLRSVELVGGDAGGRFEATDFVDLHAVITYSFRHSLQHILREVLCRGLQFVEWRQLVDVPMIEIRHDLIRRRFQLHEINQQADVIQLTSARIDLNLVVVAMQILTLAPVAAQLVRAGEIPLNHHFECSRHSQSTDYADYADLTKSV